MMLKISKVGKILIPLLLIPTLFFYLIPSGSADDNQLNNSGHDDENHPLPNYGPESFERAKNETGFITTRGKMPEIHQEEEKRKWIDLLTKGSQSLSTPGSTSGLNPYFVTSGGPVNSFGVYIDGYLEVGFEPSTLEKVNESVIDEIYQIIDKHFEQEGISEVPVVFKSVRITDDIAPVDRQDSNESSAVNSSGNIEKLAGNETTNRSPGFTSLMVVLGLLSLLIIKRS